MCRLKSAPDYERASLGPYRTLQMAVIDILYLSVVLVAFFGFAGVLAYVSLRNRLPNESPDETTVRFPFTNIPPI
jgi:hypothetical protein